MREDAVRIVHFEEVDDHNGRMPPPIWVVAVVVAVVTGGWLLATQGSTDTDPVTSPTLLPATPDEASVVTPTVASPTAVGPVSVVRDTPIAIIGETASQLRGYVAVTSPDTLSTQTNVQILQAGGRLVSKTYNVIPRGNLDYPILITAGRLLLGGRIFDIDLAALPISLWTDGSVIPGSGPGVVWLAGPGTGPGTDDYSWVSKVDVESLTVGERVDITDVFSRPIVGVGDGLIVATWEEGYAYWSPSDGLVPLDHLGELDSVVAASGDFVVVASPGSVRVLDITSGEYADPIMLGFDFTVPVTSACLSPDGQHVIIVGFNGEAVVGNTQTGEIVRRLKYAHPLPITIEPKHGIGWTTNDQLVFVGDIEDDASHLFSYDIASGESYVFGQLDSDNSSLTASGTMC